MINKGYSALGKFILTIDQWFDYMNAGFQGKNFKPARQPFESAEDQRLSWLINDFLGYLSEWEECVASRPLVGDVNRELMLMSNATRSGLKIATLSMVEIVKLTLESGARYVLPRRINQDPLEAYFGRQREKASRTRNPTVSMFISNDKGIAVLKNTKRNKSE